jgi:hypothetical protein
MSGVNRRTARTLLRLLRRRGYLDTLGESGDGAPRRWALTPAGRSLRDRAPGHLGAIARPRCPIADTTGPVGEDDVVPLMQALR